MIQALLMAMVACVLARDGLPGLPLLHGLPTWQVALFTLAGSALVGVFPAPVVAYCMKRLSRQGRWRHVRMAELAVGLSRIGALIVHVVAVLGLGWLDAVRSWVGGNLILVDEVIAMLPGVGVIVLGWVWIYPLEKRMREAALVRELDEGGAVHPIPTCAAFVWEQMRHQVLLILAPVTLIALWSEAAEWAIARWLSEAPWVAGLWGQIFVLAVHLVGVALVLVIMPLVLRILWNTVPLGAGHLRDRLLAMCAAQGVRCRELLVWRTSAGLLNGAVIGVLPVLRYILLTDGLLERLPERQVEAVMAHELAHARRHHLPWLILSLMASVSAAWVALGYLASLLGWIPEAPPSPLPDEASAPVTFDPGAFVAGLIFVLSFGIGMLVFGAVSRCYERQADAFAAQHLSGLTRNGTRDPTLRIQPEAIEAMSGALAAVADLNHIPQERFSFRHGSIAARRRRLEALSGMPAARLPIDRIVVAVKVASAILLAGVIALVLTSAIMMEARG